MDPKDWEVSKRNDNFRVVNTGVMDLETVFGAPVLMTRNHFFGVDPKVHSKVDIYDVNGKLVNKNDVKNNLTIRAEKFSAGHVYLNLNL